MQGSRHWSFQFSYLRLSFEAHLPVCVWHRIAYAGVASRTRQASWAIECLHKFELRDGSCLAELIDVMELRVGSKQVHLKSILTTVGCRAEEVLFFDNEITHCGSAAALGSTAVWCPAGLTRRAWRQGLRRFPATGQVVDAQH